MSLQRAVTRADLWLDVSRVVPWGGAGIAASLYEPAGRSQALLVCSPGGTYPRGSLDLNVAGQADYAVASWLACRNFSVLTVDTLGTGDSTRPENGDLVRIDLAAAALDAATRQVAAQLPAQTVVGIGHSLGGWTTVAAQARHHAFDAIAVLGYSPSWSFLGAEPSRPTDPDERWTWALDRYATASPELWSGSYVQFPRRTDDGFSHVGELPGEVHEALAGHYTPVPRGLAVEFGSPLDGLADAWKVDVPVYLGFGATDVSSPAAELENYPSAPSITEYVLDGAGHYQFTASNRVQLWRHLAQWTTSIPTAEAPRAQP